MHLPLQTASVFREILTFHKRSLHGLTPADCTQVCKNGHDPAHTTSVPTSDRQFCIPDDESVWCDAKSEHCSNNCCCPDSSRATIAPSLKLSPGHEFCIDIDGTRVYCARG